MQKLLYLLAFTTLLIIGCGKDSDVFVPDPNEPLPERVVASVLGIVTDQFGEPVSGADVLLETYSGTTNELGLFLFRDVEIYEDAYVRVDKSGYFNGSRRFYPIQGHTAQIGIQLLSSNTVGAFQSAAGGTVDLNGGTRLTFPPDAIVTQNGSAYTGMVNVSAVPLYTSDPDMLTKMPGDLVGRNVDGQLRALGSFGMIAAELRDGSGSLLQVASGKEATIEFVIADHQLSTAPSSIPLWYFNEETGYWKEEGEAQRIGNSYVGQVAHFSFWNCDAPFPLITLTGSVVYDNGEPASGLYICVTVPGLNTSSGGSTDGDGVFSGKVPKDQELIITVKDHNGCELLLFEVTVGPFSDDVTIPPITITFTTSELVTATGLLVDCNGDPVEDGIVDISYGSTSRYIYVDDGNAFSFTFYNCDEGPVTAKAYDYINEKESLSVTLNHAALIDFGTIQICEDLTEYLNVFADGQTVSFVLPHVFVNGTGSSNTSVQGSGIQDSTTYFFVNVPGITTGAYDIGGPNGAEVFLDLGFGNWGNVQSGTATFTYFGDPGDFVMGTMEGTYVEFNSMQQQMEYPFTCEFKILRD
jgi:hypothetical protein